MDKDKSAKTQNPNDQRSDVKNPNNPAFKADHDNRANQLNPNNPEYKGDTSKDAGGGKGAGK
jgi:hypothetical protein